MPQTQPVGPRAPKDDFMRALGLSTTDPRHEGYYRAMRVRLENIYQGNRWGPCSPRKQEEAIAVYNRLNSDRSSLIDEKRNDASTTPPFFWHHIRPERRRQAIIDTWQLAKPGTIQRTLFDRGATTGEHAPNWVTLWLLYSVFRSRDIRNNRNRRAGESGAGGGHSSGSHDAAIFDPARDKYVRR
ncbi:hypothetical protein HRR81_003952 [Exophiala dermatitidis]|nr:hypothetical protein HRR75_006303 [Exophiala dermatitidis]KAJ4510670.1 hypothetical protein HRR73_006742 [Exophiala dermatitidis]KAJ4545540.1 hypothetical protein HRR78_006262 [Exophiala dermatitidis]KAJ4575815.1 hypothetical protein HRR82_006108 [Exophiala dermatitidis]KAJ4576064.1 hypothetical protein HRR81_003952 [Exophiala dermatitidis]